MNTSSKDFNSLVNLIRGSIVGVFIMILFGVHGLTTHAAVAPGYVAPSATTPPPGALPTNTGINQVGDLITNIGIIVRWSLGFVGIVIFLIFLFSGFEYATAGDDENKAGSARKRMTNAVVGMIIVFLAFVLSNTILGFVFQNQNTQPRSTTYEIQSIEQYV